MRSHKLTCIYMLGIGAATSSAFGHHAPTPSVLFSRAIWDSVVASNSLDAVIYESGIVTDPLTNGVSEVHVGALRPWNV